MSQIKVNSIVPAGGLPAGASGGGIVQIVQASHASNATSTSSTYADTGLSASITPTSSSNKILVIVYAGHCVKTSNDTQLDLKVLRGATDIYSFSSLNTNSASDTDTSNMTILYLDSPATTSSTTYKTQFRNRDSSGTVYVNLNGSSEITLMEVSG